MDPATLVMIAAGVAVALLVAGVASMLVKTDATAAEERLENVTSGRAPSKKRKKATETLLKAPPINAGQVARFGGLLPTADGLRSLYAQADIDLPPKTFAMIAAGMGAAGLIGGFLLLSPMLAPLPALVLGAMLPMMFLSKRKKSRVAKYMAALPEAVELMGRALRAGHGLASGMQLVAHEMRGPVADEFGRAFEEQNLGVPIDEALRGMAERVPTMDVRFLVTAIVIQRTTGGDLAEVLDKIGRLIRQRFELAGHVKSLTAEGRLSGALLMALPPALLGFLAFANREYITPLFTTPLGTKMLAVTVVLQLLGAVAIKKIISIKV